MSAKFLYCYVYSSINSGGTKEDNSVLCSVPYSPLCSSHFFSPSCSETLRPEVLQAMP